MISYGELSEIVGGSGGWPVATKFDDGSEGIVQRHSSKVITVVYLNHPDVRDGWVLYRYFNDDGAVEETFSKG